MGAPLLSAGGLHVGYGLTKVIRGLDFDVQTGERLCILGGNGSGKSTLLLAIAGLIGSNTGTLDYEGVSLHRMAHFERYRRGIVLIPQNRMLFANKTVRENLELACLSIGLRSTAVEGRLERVMGTLPFLERAASKKTGLLSGGEQQIVALGRALMAEPKLLLMDEPTAGLAPIWIDQMEEGLKVARREFDLTYILVEQNVRVGLANTDRLIVLRNGVVALTGESKSMRNESELFKAYLG